MSGAEETDNSDVLGKATTAMTETLYTADPELRHPLRFIASAREDLRHAGTIGWQLFRRNVQVRYRHAWLGYLWLLLPTIGTTVVWAYMYTSGIVRVSPPSIPYPVHVLAGMTLWQTFIDALNAPLQQLKAGQQFVTRSRVPHEALILAGALEVLLNCGARLLVLAALLIVYHVPIGASVILAPIGITAVVLLGLAFGVFVAPAGLLYGDVPRAITLATGLWFFLTPVVYLAPVSGILRFNPMTPLLETTRGWLTASGAMTDGFVLVCVASVVLLIVAWLVQRLARPHIVATLG